MTRKRQIRRNRLKVDKMLRTIKRTNLGEEFQSNCSDITECFKDLCDLADTISDGCDIAERILADVKDYFGDRLSERDYTVLEAEINRDFISANVQNSRDYGMGLSKLVSICPKIKELYSGDKETPKRVTVGEADKPARFASYEPRDKEEMNSSSKTYAKRYINFIEKNLEKSLKDGENKRNP